MFILHCVQYADGIVLTNGCFFCDRQKLQLNIKRNCKKLVPKQRLVGDDFKVVSYCLSMYISIRSMRVISKLDSNLSN
jgi:hypothetical protein